MNTNETTKDNEQSTSVRLELAQDRELSVDELESVDGGLLPAVRNKLSPVGTQPESHGIIAVLIGL